MRAGTSFGFLATVSHRASQTSITLLQTAERGEQLQHKPSISS